MSEVFTALSMSLDGYIAGPNDSPEQSLGDGGDRLFEWLHGGETASRYYDSFTLSSSSAEVLDESVEASGAIVSGRRTYDVSSGWGGSGPAPGVPLFVLTHEVPAEVPDGETTYTFVTDGIESAIEQAKAAAGDEDVGLMGANITSQCIRAGLLDEIQIHLVPVLLGDGVRLFEHFGAEQIELERTRVIESPDVTHLRFRVVQ